MWDNCNNYSPSIITFFRASHGRIWTQIGGNESQRLPGPPYPPQNRRFGPEKFKKYQNKIKTKTVKNMKIPYYAHIEIAVTLIVVKSTFYQKMFRHISAPRSRIWTTLGGFFFYGSPPPFCTAPGAYFEAATREKLKTRFFDVFFFGAGTCLATMKV